MNRNLVRLNRPQILRDRIKEWLHIGALVVLCVISGCLIYGSELYDLNWEVHHEDN